MADYDSALPISLGDYLSYECAQKRISRGELEKKIKIASVIGYGESANEAIKKFNKVAKDYETIINIQENSFEKHYVIRALGIKEMSLHP